MNRLYEPGDWVQYKFCGGISYARLNSYKWYVPRPWTDRNGATHYPDPKVVYNATKLYGIRSGYPSVSSAYVQTGWKPQVDHYVKYPEHRRDDWPEGMQPTHERRTHTFLPVWQEDIIGKADFDNLTLPDPYQSDWHIPNLIAWFDKEKLENMCNPALTDDPNAEKHEWFINRFEERKHEVLTRKLEQ
jgi:hypothetical protein